MPDMLFSIYSHVCKPSLILRMHNDIKVVVCQAGTGSLVADIQKKITQKHFPNFMSPCINLPLILMKPGLSQG